MRRRLLMIAVFALIGVIISASTGWAAVLWRVFVAKPYLGAQDGPNGVGEWPVELPRGWPEPDSVSVTRGWAYERVIATGAACETPQGLMSIQDAMEEWAVRQTREFDRMTQELEAYVREDPGSLAEHATRLRTRIRAVPPAIQSVLVFRRRSGWPVLCMESSWINRSGSNGATTPDLFGNGWTSRMYWERGLPWPRLVHSGHFNLPLRPAGWAFALNGALWGFVAWLALRGVWLARSRFRERRGVCPACRYPVGVSDVCTECGRPVRARRAGA